MSTNPLCSVANCQNGTIDCYNGVTIELSLDVFECLVTNCLTDSVPRAAIKEQNLGPPVIMDLAAKT